MMNAILRWLLHLSPEELAGGRWSVGFSAEEGGLLRLAMILLAAGCVVWAARNYRREEELRPVVRRQLTVLRSAVFLLLILALFQPAVLLRAIESRDSTLLVLLDDSLSMSFSDRRSGGTPPERRVDLLRRLMRQEVWTKLNADHPLEWLRFSGSPAGEDAGAEWLGTIPRGALQAEGGLDRRERILSRLAASGHETDYAAALRDALERFPDRRIGGVVLLGDGRDTRDDAPERLRAAADFADRLGAVRYTVLTGDPTPFRLLALVSLRGPREVRAGGGVEFTATLAQRGWAGQTVEVRLYRRRVDEAAQNNRFPAPLLVKKTVVLKSPSAKEEEVSQTVRLRTTPSADAPGEFVYRAEVVPPSEDFTVEDNFAEAFLRVSDRKLRILLLSRDAGWEFRSLRNFFLRQPEEYGVSVWQQDADPEGSQSASAGMRLTRLPRTLRELLGDGPAGAAAPSGYDVVILYDPVPTRGGFDRTMMENLHEFVVRHRGGLCYIASTRNTVEVLRDPAAKKLAVLLPVVVARNPMDVARMIHETRPQAWPVRLTPYGLDHPITMLETLAEENRKVWSLLPGVYRAQAVVRRKPAARVLAEFSDPASRMLRQDEPIPLLAVQTVGGGRVAYLGTDETWRWRFLEEGKYHRRFWDNVVRSLAPMGSGRVVFSTGGDRFVVGRPIPVEAEVYDADYRPWKAENFSVRLVEFPGGKSVEYVLPATKGRPGFYRAEITPPHTGTYELACDPKFAGPDKAPRKILTVEPPRAEYRRREADARTMRDLASRPEFALQPEEISRLAEVIPPGRLQKVRERRFPLWDTPAMWMLVAVLLTLEWWTRKKANLA